MADEATAVEETTEAVAETQAAEVTTEATAETAAPETVAEPASKWPEDWRKEFAGDDEKALKELDRFQSPKDVAAALRESQKLIRSGAHKKPLAADATPEQVAEWRKEQGIPETPEGYLEKLPGGLVIGDDDKPLVETFISDMHAQNAPPALVHKALDWYHRTQERAAAAQAEADTTFRAKVEDELRADWGPEYRANLNSAMSLLDTMPVMDDGTAVKDLFLKGRLADGTPIGNHPGVLRWLTRMAAEAGSSGFIAPSDGASRIESVETEIASIEKTMREQPRAYFKDNKMQERYRTLLDAQEKLKARA